MTDHVLRLRTILLASGFIFCASSICCADPDPERILSFAGDITVNEDASITVSESIRVLSTGSVIVHGIYRDFPTSYRDRFGNRHRVDFDLVGVSRDGLVENYHFADRINGKRIYLGDKDVLLSPGEHTYNIVYKTNRQLGFFQKHDELYWNVTGNAWSFPIDEVSVIVRLPRPLPREGLYLDGYTGYQGEQGKDFNSSVDLDGNIVFSSTRAFRPEEGLTIAVSWPKGLVREPDIRTRLGYFYRDNRSGIWGLLGLLILVVYYLSVWARFGKDPSRGIIIPLYAPPDNFSPAAVRYISKMGFDHKALAAAIIDMAVKGFLKIDQGDGSYTISRGRGDESVLSPEEKVIAKKLFGGSDEVRLKNTNLQIRGAMYALSNALRVDFEKKYFITNRQYFIPGVILSMALIAASSIGAVLESGSFVKIPMALFMSIWLGGWSLGVTALLREVLARWRDLIFAERQRAGLLAAASGITVFSLPFIAGELFGLAMLIYATSVIVVIVLAAAVAVNFLFYHLLKAPTLAGRKTMDRIEGFKMYLSVAEKDNLRMASYSQVTPEIFEKYLPYALSLGVEQAWSERFAAYLAQAGKDRTEYSPAWYSGALWNSSSAGSFASGLGSSLSGAIASSSTAPGSRSGGGGGGSSGGGGGGGGGGGW